VLRQFVLSFGAILVASTARQAQAQFTDISATSGADVGGVKDGGATFADLDGDGWLDLVVNTNGRSVMLRNDGGAPPSFVDVTTTAAPSFAARAVDRAIVIADLNHDGHPDLVRTDYDRLEVMVNGGPPDFAFSAMSFYIDRASDPTLNAEGLALLDYDGDGWLDLFAENVGPRIYRNPANGTVDFTVVPTAMTELPDFFMMTGNAADYVTATDFDVDGDVDLAHRNAASVPLFSNDGDGTFTALSSPDIDAENATKAGIRFCDFDNDGLFDLLFTGHVGGGRNRVHFQSPPGTFTESTTPDSMSDTVSDAACGDVDHDGDLDLYLTHDGPDVLYLNQLAETGTATFTEGDLGVATPLVGRSANFVDYDNDGDLDLYVNRTGNTVYDDTLMLDVREPALNVLYRNDLDDDDYLMVEVLAPAGACPTPSRRSHLGAVVSVDGPMGWQSGVREINGGQGRGTQGSPRVHFGLPGLASRSHTVTVRFTGTAIPDVSVDVIPADLGPYHLLTVDGMDLDGDGILTTTEMADAGANPDPDGDGRPAWNDDDSDGDGISDADEAGDDDLCTPPADADGNAIPDYLDAPGTTPQDGGITDTGPPATPDGNIEDSGAGVSDSSLNLVAAHGSGCVRCAAAPGGDDAGPLALTALLLAFVARRRSRR